VSFLRPIALSKKARWLNIKNEINWLEDIYNYEEKSDFHLINTGVKIKNAQTILEKYNISDTEKIETIDAGKVRFDEKFAVLKKHNQYYLELKELNEVTEKIKSIVKKNGLSLNVLQEIEIEYDKIKYNWVKEVFQDIINKLIAEHSKCGMYSKPILCCSDIIESIFGKFKIKTKQVVGGIYETVLGIVLFCNNITDELIAKILTEVKMSDVDNWFEQMSGVSNLAKRRIAFG